MVKGLEKFSQALGAYSDSFVIIGGTACDVVLSGTRMRPRATVDIDMILIVENLNQDFMRAFWQFIRDGKYHGGKRGAAESPAYVLYRFVNPESSGYPIQIELLSRHNNIFGEPSGFRIEPIPADEGLSSLSAIIMDKDYYDITVANSFIDGGLRFASPAALICLKAKAYLNLIAERALGNQVNTKDIKKHRSDVIKLAAVLDVNETMTVSETIAKDLTRYISDIRAELPSKSLEAAIGVGSDEIEEFLMIVEEFFNLK